MMNETDIIPETGALPTSQEKFVDILIKYLKTGQPLDVGGFRFRYLKKGEIFLEGDSDFEALESGVFIRLPTFQTADDFKTEVVSEYRWVYYCQMDDLDFHTQDSFYFYMSPYEREKLYISMVFNLGMIKSRRL